MNTETQPIARRLDGVLLIFRGYEGIWMIDRVGAPANDRGDEEWIELPDGLLSARGNDGYDDGYDDTGRDGEHDGYLEDDEEYLDRHTRDQGRGGYHRAAFEGATAVSVDELCGMTDDERRSFHARQLRKLGLPDKSGGAKIIWSMIENFQAFSP